jgi:hypothetical protein
LLEVAPLTVAVPFWQIVWLPPAVAVGGNFIIKFLFEVAFEQPVFPVAVRVSVLLPAAMSAGLGS